MFETIVNAFKTKEIRVKIWLTLLMLLVYRIGCYIPIPGLNASTLETLIGGTGDFLGILSMMSGGSLSSATLFSLGIGPFTRGTGQSSEIFQKPIIFRRTPVLHPSPGSRYGGRGRTY